MVRAGVNIVRLPKTDTPDDVLRIEKEIQRIEHACGHEPGSTGLLAAVESATGITQAPEIAQCSPRLIGITLGAEDYVRNLRTNVHQKALSYSSPVVLFYRPRAQRIFRRLIPFIPMPTTMPGFSKKPHISNSLDSTVNTD